MSECLQKRLLDQHPEKLDFQNATYTRRRHLSLDLYEIFLVDLKQQRAWTIQAEEAEGFPEQLTLCDKNITQMLLAPFQRHQDIFANTFYVNVLKSPVNKA